MERFMERIRNTPHCGNYCWRRTWGGVREYHSHGNAKRKRFRKGRWPRPTDGFGGRVNDRHNARRAVRTREREEARRWEDV